MHAMLQGRDFDRMGVVHVLTPAPDVALAITRGFHPKPYDYVDPNEDVVAALRQGPVTVLMVADGHNGHEGSHTVVDAVRQALPDPLPTAPSRRDLVETFFTANEHLRAVRSTLPQPNRQTRSTLSVVLITAAEDGHRRMVAACVGDSAVLIGDRGGVSQVSRDRNRFMGDRLSMPEMAGSMDLVEYDLARHDTVVVCTDGFTNFASAADVPAALAAADPAATARGLIDLAGSGGAGDNVAVAVLAAPGGFADGHR